MPRLYVLAGLPGAGKTTYARAHLAGAVRISLDDLRLMMSGSTYDPTYEPMVAVAAAAVLEAILEDAGRREYDVVFDATNVTRDYRARAIDQARRWAVEPHCVYFDLPLELAMERNRQRQQVVPSDVMRSFYGKLEEPTLEEGFVQIVRVTM